jgi:hypothetical protein
MAGLIDTGINGTEQTDVLAPGKTLQATGVGFEPEKRTVDANETVSGQIDNLMSKGSPVLERARAGAMQRANERGLLNSSMAAQAGEAAVLDAALPIASADASVHNLAKRENQAAGNTALQFGANATNQATAQNVANAGAQTLQTMRGEQETGLQTLRGAQAKDLQTLQGDQAMQLQGLRGDQAKQLADIEANYKNLIQANQSAATQFNTAMSSIAAVMADTYTSAEQKQSAVNKITQMLQSSLTVAGSIANIDIAGLLDFSAP